MSDGELFGFAVERRGWEGYHYIVHASKDVETGVVTCHDLAGWSGSWEMNSGDVFFQSLRGEPHDDELFKFIHSYTYSINEKIKAEIRRR